MSTHISKQVWGHTQQGDPVQIYTIRNDGGLACKIMELGATITSVTMPASDGDVEVVLGFDTFSEYISPAYVTANPFFGATIGRFANRIARGELQLESSVYQLSRNEHGNCLHGGFRGFDKRLWESKIVGQDTVEMHLSSPDGEEGFPGNLDVVVSFSLQDSDGIGDLIITYELSSDALTVANLTNHTYFNLVGRGEALDHEIQIFSDQVLELDQQAIPTGRILPVAGTSLDFALPLRFRDALGRPGNTDAISGYAHTFLLEGGGVSEPRLAACMLDPGSGRAIEVLTTEPGVLIYGGEGLDGSLEDRRGGRIEKGSGLCLETQHIPDAPNHANFIQAYVHPGKKRISKTIYRFRQES